MTTHLITLGHLGLSGTSGIEKTLASVVVIVLTVYAVKHKKRKMLLVLWSFVAGWLAGAIIIHYAVDASGNILQQIWSAITGVFHYVS